MQIHSLHVYPIKGCRGVSLSSVNIGPLGPHLDRNWMLVQPGGQRVSLRRFPQLTQIHVQIEDERRILVHRAGSRGKVRIHVNARGTSCKARLPQAHIDAQDLGDDAANWFSDIVGTPVRLVRKGDRPRYSPGERHGGLVTLAFADVYPLMICSLESMAWLNARLSTPVSMGHFRPNVVLEGGRPLDEDLLLRFSLANVRLMGEALTPRCRVVNVDPDTGETDVQIFRDLCAHRLIEGKPRFGLYADHLSSGTITVNDEVSIQSWRRP